MRKVEPYRSFDGANRALDNGGRLWNLFTEAADRVITKAEIAKAGGGGGWIGALLFFDLSTSRLNEGEREELVHRLSPKLRRRWRQQGPEVVTPAGLDRLENTKRPYLVEGVARKVEEKSLTTAFIPITTMIGNVPITTMTPITEVFAVYEVRGDRGGTGLVLARKGSGLKDGTRARFAGTLRPGQAGKEKGSRRRGYLSARFYLELD